MFQSFMFWLISSNRTSSLKRLCLGATSWVWFSCSFNKFVFLEEDNEKELDWKEIREKERKSLDMIITFSNIFSFIWFHRNIFVSKYVAKFLGSEIFFKEKLFFSFFHMYSLNGISIATSLLCPDTLVQQYILALLPFIHHRSYCYNTIQLKY